MLFQSSTPRLPATVASVQGPIHLPTDPVVIRSVVQQTEAALHHLPGHSRSAARELLAKLKGQLERPRPCPDSVLSVMAQLRDMMEGRAGHLDGLSVGAR